MTNTHTITIAKSTAETLEYTITDAEASVEILAQKGVEATVSIVCDPSGDSSIDLQITVDVDAKLTVLCMQVASSHHMTLRQNSTIADGGQLSMHNISLGADIDQSYVSHVQGARAVSDIDWIFCAENSDTQKLSARNIFDGKDGGGEITLKGVAQDTARVECIGCIDIGLGGSGTDTYLTEDILMLDATATVDALPGLEIKTNDVQASHSATVSKVTPEDVFYFASRGIDEETARQMYVQGFLGDSTKKIVDEGMRERVLDSIEKSY